MGNRFVPVTVKITVFILISLTIGIGSITFFLTRSLATTIDRTTEESLQQASSIVYKAIEQLMMPGEAPLVVNYISGIAESNAVYEIHLYRRNGAPAFSDNATIEFVNSFSDTAMFVPRTSPAFAPNMVTDTDAFGRATGMPPRNVVTRETDGEEVFVRFYKPLINLPKCTVCHASDHTVRGVIDIRADITASVKRQRMVVTASAGVFLAVVALTSVLMSIYLRRGFIAPLREIGATCNAVTEGDFDRRSSVSNNDELGVLSETVNTMVQGLYERFVLSRYVSSSTLAALGDTSTSRSEELTLLFTDIRGFTSFSEQHTPQEVVTALNHVLSGQTEIIADLGGDIDKYVGDEIVAVFSGEEGMVNACTAAIRVQRMLDDREEFSGLHVGIGINHGPVILGSVGSSVRADFTAVGDNVNIAARLCSGAAAGEILLTQRVADTVRERFKDALDGPYRMQAKGKSEALRVYKLNPDAVHETVS